MKKISSAFIFRSIGLLLIFLALTIILKLIGPSSEEGLGGGAEREAADEIISAKNLPEESVKSDSETPLKKGLIEVESSRWIYQKELKGLSTIVQKIYPTQDEQQQLKEWLGNSKFILSLGHLLAQPARDVNEKKMQNSALKLVLKADRLIALKVIERVVADDKIENSKLPMKERRELAGIKAELIYEWISANPEDTQLVVDLLPGPVSKKIWKRVQHLQESNVGLSMNP